MKVSTVKVIVGIVLAIGVFSAFIGWYPFIFSLAWPGLALARVGVPHSWIVSAILLLGGVTWLGLWSRRQPWLAVIIASSIFPASYCVIAFFYVARGPVPLPSVTPYDSIPPQRDAYL